MTKQELFDKHGIPLLSECAQVEDLFPNRPMWYKIEFVTKFAAVTEEKATEALKDYQHFTEI